MSHVVRWETNIAAASNRSNVLTRVSDDGAPLRLEFNDEDGVSWIIEFRLLQAVRITAEECADRRIILPGGGFYEVIESELIDELRSRCKRIVDSSRHFVITFYDEVVEVIAADYKITRA